MQYLVIYRDTGNWEYYFGPFRTLEAAEKQVQRITDTVDNFQGSDGYEPSIHIEGMNPGKKLVPYVLEDLED